MNAEALEVIDKGEDISVIISDYRMPAERCRLFQGCIHVVIRKFDIMLTGFTALDNVIMKSVLQCLQIRYQAYQRPRPLRGGRRYVVMRISTMRTDLITIGKELLELNSELAKDNENLRGELYKQVVSKRANRKCTALRIVR